MYDNPGKYTTIMEMLIYTTPLSSDKMNLKGGMVLSERYGD